MSFARNSLPALPGQPKAVTRVTCNDGPRASKHVIAFVFNGSQLHAVSERLTRNYTPSIPNPACQRSTVMRGGSLNSVSNRCSRC